jgi:hypothetical protein
MHVQEGAIARVSIAAVQQACRHVHHRRKHPYTGLHARYHPVPLRILRICIYRLRRVSAFMVRSFNAGHEAQRSLRACVYTVHCREQARATLR